MKNFAILLAICCLIAAMAHPTRAGSPVRTEACDEVIQRSFDELQTCCRAHGFVGNNVGIAPIYENMGAGKWAYCCQGGC